jgi:DNA-binding transcriptional ArsR family regulator
MEGESMAEIPESGLIQSEVVLREMMLTDEVKMTRKSLIRWLALSLGLISPKESRQSVLTLFEALLFYHLKDKRGANYTDITEYFKQQSVEMNEKTIRYHLTQLRKAGVLEDGRGIYKFTGFQSENLAEALEQSYKMKANTAFSNIKTAVDLLKKMHEA